MFGCLGARAKQLRVQVLLIGGAREVRLATMLLEPLGGTWGAEHDHGTGVAYQLNRAATNQSAGAGFH